MITINPDFDLLLWILLLTLLIGGIGNIIFGIEHKEKDKYYTLWDTATGIVWIILVIIILVY